MNKRIIMALGISLAMLLGGCSDSTGSTSESEITMATAEEGLHATASTVTLTEGKYSEEKLDDTWDDTAAEILCEGSTVTADSDGVSVTDSVITISQEGTYVLTGTLDDGQVVVDVANKGNVKLVFNGVSLTSTSTAPVYIKEGTVVITLAPDTENTVTDGQEYIYETGEDEPKAAIFAKDDLTFNGTGTLNVTGNYNNGIQCKDDLKFVTGTYYITAANNAIVGKDSVSVKKGNFTIEAGGDGIKATNTEETDKGYILIETGSFTITAGADGIQAETLLRINDGDFDIVTGGGSQEAVQYGEMPQTAETTGDSTETESMKGLKSYVDLIIAGGTFNMDVCDDGVHSNQNVTVEDGTLTIQAGDDGIHADQKLTVNGGNIDIQKSYEGLEGMEIEINDGDVKVIASDDGINAAGENQGALFTINGGSVYVNANGDGLDANGDIYINGGTVIVHGPADGGNGTLDFASECKITGGTFLADGSAGMVQNPSDTSTQPVIIYSAAGEVEAQTTVSLTDTDGNVLAEYTTEKVTQWFALSTPEMKEGETYILQIGNDSIEVTATSPIS